MALYTCNITYHYKIKKKVKEYSLYTKISIKNEI